MTNMELIALLLTFPAGAKIMNLGNTNGWALEKVEYDVAKNEVWIS